MKKIIFFVLFACTFLVNANQADAQIRIGAILNAPNEISTNTEQLEKLNIRLAELLPSDKYEVLPIQEMMEKEKEYRRNKNIFQAPNQLTPPALSQEALCELGKNSNCDYLVLIKQEYTDAVRKYVILVPGSPEKKINLTTMRLRTHSSVITGESVCGAETSSSLSFSMNSAPLLWGFGCVR